MKHVITPVGTSLFSNYREANGSNNTVLVTLHNRLESRPASDWDHLEEQVNRIKTNERFHEWIRQEQENASAELSSLKEISDWYDETIQVHLIAFDTMKPRLAADILSDRAPNVLNSALNGVSWNSNLDVMKNLRVDNPKNFQKGLKNVIKRSNEKRNNCSSQHLCVNITAGCKALIPYLNTFGHIHDLDVFYTFQENRTLLRIPNIPVEIDWDLLEANEDKFLRLKEGVYDYKGFKQDNYQDVYIYKAFDKHSDYEQYLEKSDEPEKTCKKTVRENSELRRIERSSIASTP